MSRLWHLRSRQVGLVLFVGPRGGSTHSPVAVVVGVQTVNGDFLLRECFGLLRRCLSCEAEVRVALYEVRSFRVGSAVHSSMGHRWFARSALGAANVCLIPATNACCTQGLREILDTGGRFNAQFVASTATVLLQHLETVYVVNRIQLDLADAASPEQRFICGIRRWLTAWLIGSLCRAVLRHISNVEDASSSIMDGCFGSRQELTDSLCDLLATLRWVSRLAVLVVSKWLHAEHDVVTFVGRVPAQGRPRPPAQVPRSSGDVGEEVDDMRT